MTVGHPGAFGALRPPAPPIAHGGDTGAPA